MILAAWVGLASGSLGAIFQLVPRAVAEDWPLWRMESLQNLWIPVLTDLTVFLLLGLVLMAAGFVVRGRHHLMWSTGIFVALGSYGLISSAANLQERGAVVLATGLGSVAARWMNRDPAVRFKLVRRSLAPLAVAVLALCLLPWPAEWLRERFLLATLPQAPQDAPNILVVVIDTLRADRLGVYGNQSRLTPFLDEWAQRSAVFEHAFANSSWTLPSHVSLFTGTLPHEHGAEVHRYDRRFPTLAGRLAEQGYATVALVANASFAGYESGVLAGFQWAATPRPWSVYLRSSIYVQKFAKYVSKAPFKNDFEHIWQDAAGINQEFLQWIHSRPPRPFFAFLNFMDVHEPYNAFTTELSPPADRAAEPLACPADAAQVRDASQRYDAAISLLDRQLRHLFETLRQLDLDRNLLVVITSDHGQAFGEHGLLGHRESLYLEQLHVPLLIRFPGQKDGWRSSVPVGLQQIPASVADWVGLEGEPFPGRPLPASSEVTDPDAAVLSDLTGGPWPGVATCSPIYQGGIRSLLTAEWHLLEQNDGKVELFAWPRDPTEEHNLAARPEYQNVMASLLERLGQLRSEGGH